MTGYEIDLSSVINKKNIGIVLENEEECKILYKSLDKYYNSYTSTWEGLDRFLSSFRSYSKADPMVAVLNYGYVGKHLQRCSRSFWIKEGYDLYNIEDFECLDGLVESDSTLSFLLGV